MNHYTRMIVALILLGTVGCGAGAPNEVAVVPTATKNLVPTFTVAPSVTPTAPATETPAPTATPTLTPSPQATHTPTVAPSATRIPPTSTTVPATNTPIPATATATSTPAPTIDYVIAGANRELNCNYTSIYGRISNANNEGLAGVQVRAEGIHKTEGTTFTTTTDEQGRYEIFRIPFNELPAAEWAVYVMNDGRRASEPFYWAETSICQSDDPGHSQVLRVDWKLVE